MSTKRHPLSNEQGFALFYMAVFLTMLCIFVGLAVDTGRAYVVQAQLSKAVDGAALGAARMLNSGNPQTEAANIYRANFPNGWMGTTSSTSPSESGFFTMTTDAQTGVNRVHVRATAVVPTTFMRLANFQELRVNALGEATRAGILGKPLTPEQAIAFVGEWLEQPYVSAVGPGEGHWQVLRNLVRTTGTAGALVADAHLAALAIELGATIYSTDHDFRRFPGIEHVDPLGVASD